MENEIFVSDSICILPGIEAVVVFQDNIFEKPAQPPLILETSPTVSYKSTTKTLGVVQNGDGNNLPVSIKEKVEKNAVGSACLDFLIDMTSGQGVKYGRKQKNEATGTPDFIEATDGEYPDIEAFFTENNIHELFDEAITDLEWFNKIYIELILDRNNPDKRKIKFINHKEYVFSRVEEMDSSGRSQNHYYSALWGQGVVSKDDYEVTPMLDPKRPIIDLQTKIGRIADQDGNTIDKKEYRYVFSIQLPTPGHSYYPRAAWWSIIDSSWIDFANQIPAFKQALMKNQVTLKYIIKINKNYFPEIFAKEGLKTKEEQEARRKKEFDDIKKYLTGVENTGNSMFTYFRMTPDGKVEEPNIVIEVLDNKFKGGEYIDDSHEAAAMTFTAFQVHPSLIGVIPGKTSTNISGSDKWALMKIQQARAIRKRNKLLQILYLVKEINRWPSEVHFTIPDMIISEDNPRQRMKPGETKTDNATQEEQL